MDKEQIEKCVELFCIESNTDIPILTYTDRRTRRIGSAYPHEWRINFNLVWFRSHSFEDCFNIIKHEVLHLKAWWITGKSGHRGYYKTLCNKYGTSSNCVYKSRSKKP